MANTEAESKLAIWKDRSLYISPRREAGLSSHYTAMLLISPSQPLVIGFDGDSGKLEAVLISAHRLNPACRRFLQAILDQLFKPPEHRCLGCRMNLMHELPSRAKVKRVHSYERHSMCPV